MLGVRGVKDALQLFIGELALLMYMREFRRRVSSFEV